MEVPVKEFQKMCLRLEMKSPSGKGIWIYHAPICAMKFVDESRYLPNEFGRPSNDRVSQNPHMYRRNKFEFENSSKENISSNMGRHSLVCVVVKEDIYIGAGEELFIDYGKYYDGFYTASVIYSKRFVVLTIQYFE